MNQNQIPSPTVLAPQAAQKPAANNNAVQSLAADTSSYARGWTIPAVVCSYSATVTGVPATLTIAWTDPSAGAVSETYYLNTTPGPQTITFPCPKHFPPGSGVTLTLSAGGNGVLNSVYAVSPILE